jgi:hypothetical protein
VEKWLENPENLHPIGTGRVTGVGAFLYALHCNQDDPMFLSDAMDQPFLALA